MERVQEELVSQLGNILGYIYRRRAIQNVSNDSHSGTDDSDDSDSSNNDQINAKSPSFITTTYRCSQEKEGNRSTYQSKVSLRKQRRHMVQERYRCGGRIRIIAPSYRSNGVKVPFGSFGAVDLSDGEILVRFFHKCGHPPRKRKPVSASVRQFIQNPGNACRTVSDMHGKLRDACENGLLPNVDLTDITDHNVRYWWSHENKQRYYRDEDPWVSAVAFMREQMDVIVHSYIHQRRRFFVWYNPKLFNIDLKTVSEVYIDSTHGTNGQNAELFGIIACENGYGIPIGYMLMEKKPTDDSKVFPGEVIEACTRFFAHARELGLTPTLVHIDKSTAEIAAIKVCSLHCFVANS
jgi:hypothetical protein